MREAYRSKALSDDDVADAVAETELLRQLRRCGRNAYTAAVARHQATRTLGLEMLERHSERMHVTSTAGDMQFEFDRFSRDTTIR